MQPEWGNFFARASIRRREDPDQSDAPFQEEKRRGRDGVRASEYL